MNWIFDTYSTVYRTAMLQSHDSQQNAAPAKERVHAKAATVLGLFRRRG